MFTETTFLRGILLIQDIQEGRKIMEQFKGVYAKTIRNGILSKLDD